MMISLRVDINFPMKKKKMIQKMSKLKLKNLKFKNISNNFDTITILLVLDTFVLNYF